MPYCQRSVRENAQKGKHVDSAKTNKQKHNERRDKKAIEQRHRMLAAKDRAYVEFKLNVERKVRQYIHGVSVNGRRAQKIEKLQATLHLTDLALGAVSERVNSRVVFDSDGEEAQTSADAAVSTTEAETTMEHKQLKAVSISCVQGGARNSHR